MADAAVGLLLENITQLLRYYAELLGDAKKEVEGLLQDLKLFKGFIRDLTEQPSKSHTMEELVNNIKSVVDEAEDAIDEFVVEMAMFKSHSRLGKAKNSISHLFTTKRVAQGIKSIREKVSGIYTQKQFGFTAQLSDSGRFKTQRKPPSVEQDNVVGFEGEANTVIERLTKGDKDLDIITIVGMAGLGKTTLARKIYDDKIIEYEFFTRAWVFVSQNYNRREVFLSILEQTTTTNYSDKSDEVIAAELRRHLEGGKYLIVMDDVWTKEAWDDFKGVFPDKKKGSRVLITSRHSHVGKYANPGEKPHKLKFLEPDESWELLEKRVFGKESCPPGELERQGRLIAARCQGLPLAIVVIAGVILNNRDSSEWWKQVAENVKTFIVEEQEELLALSYNHLPYYLKSCFLYLGVFPEDYEIPVWKLILLWIAEGFIEQRGGRSLEDIAEAYVEDLANRSLVMVAQRRPNGQIKTCRVHDILHKFCKEESQKQMLYQMIEDINNLTLDKYRRICIHKQVEEYVSSKPFGDRVRSFLCFGPREITLQRAHLSTIPKAFRLLRVLEIRSLTFEMFPKDLLQLALLRYIAISCNIKVLTSNISRLWNMQTMILITTSSTLELKEDVWKMYQLRHLHTNASATLPPPPSKTPSNKESVQRLSMISPESCTEELFARTPRIKKLGVRGEVAVLFHAYFHNIRNLQNLTNLKLFNDVYGGSSSDEAKITLPPADKFPPKLQKLTLSGTLLEWEQMQTLEKLENLEELKLKENAFKGASWESVDGGFPSLKLLHIGRTDLRTWRASKLSFPSLTHLVLQHCENLQEVPSGLADLTSLKVLKLHRTNKAVVDSARKVYLEKGSFKLDIYPPDQ